MLTDIEKKEKFAKLRAATERAKLVLKRGDRIRVTKCPGTKRTITFDHWCGCEIISKSGRGEYTALHLDRLNGVEVSFTE